MGKLREKAAEYHEEFAARIINGPRSGGRRRGRSPVHHTRRAGIVRCGPESSINGRIINDYHYFTGFTRAGSVRYGPLVSAIH